MKIFSHCVAMRKYVKSRKAAGGEIALVATMGNLHEGHKSLVKLAKTRATCVVVSIFVNPIQFNEKSDYACYPRSLDSDIKLLQEMDVDAVFTPDPREMYPHGETGALRITVPLLTDNYEGHFRPGHFEGVCTIVCKLFNIISPDAAVFGLKDYQQYLVIQQMVRDLDFNIEILCAETIRSADGLALSSRNSHLTPDQRQRACQIYHTLKQTKAEFSHDQISTLEATARSTLVQQGFEVDYFSICDSETLLSPTINTKEIVVLAAARLGNTRLIDNILFPAP